MTKREVASLAFTIAGIYALVHFAQHLYTVTSFVGFAFDKLEHYDAERFLKLAAVSLPLVLSGLLAYVLIVRSRHLAARMFPGYQASVQSPFPQTDLPRLAFAVTGLLITAQALPWLFSTAVSFVQALASFSDSKYFSSLSYWASILGQVLKVALGLSLFLCSRQLARWWAELQVTGSFAAAWRTLRPLSGVREEERTDTEG